MNVFLIHFIVITLIINSKLGNSQRSDIDDQSLAIQSPRSYLETVGIRMDQPNNRRKLAQAYPETAHIIGGRCQDYPGFVDNYWDATCSILQKYNNCNAKSWNGVPASQACCFCGGGVQGAPTPRTPPPTWRTPPPTWRTPPPTPRTPRGPWCTSDGRSESNSGVSNVMECLNGARCDVMTHGWGCCAAYGSARGKCPPEKPWMCGQPNRCASNTQYCCARSYQDCASYGGVRPCS